MFDVKLKNKGNFHSLEVVCRGSETQLQVGENIKKCLNINKYKCLM